MGMFVRASLGLLIVLLLGGCDTMKYYYNQAQNNRQEEAEYSSVPQIDPSPRIISATGYAPISLQPGQTREQKMLMAMRASKLRAYQELTAIVHGQHLFGTNQVRDMVVQNDQFNAAVGGIIRGARVVKSYPIQKDTYATILELDIRDVQRAYIDMQ
ncbi:LPP20 family lipoprotein [Motiliproteus sp.]|uniref:LPP20 family lipoprotein n=1 Tax=Motiliproteus sp. TaxID=1898955 RepID=UPI003BA8B400